MLKSLDPDSSRNYMDTVKTIDLTRLCIQITNRPTVVFPNIHTSYKEVQNKKHVNSKPKVLCDTMFRISQFWTTDIYRRIFF